MRLILQRVSSAAVTVGGETVGEIGRGVLVLVGIADGDGEAEVETACRKLAGLRLFEDSGGRMNLDTVATGGAMLVVSQFTLLASLAGGRRPSFSGAAAPRVAEPLIEKMISGLRERGLEVATGRFGAYMEVRLVNDGPVTFVLDL